jgi:hypothetical protein
MVASRGHYPITRHTPFGLRWKTGDQFSNGGGTVTVSTSSHWNTQLQLNLGPPERSVPCRDCLNNL